MTKHVRIENADTSEYKVVVQVWQTRGENEPHELVREVNLDFPTSLATETIWKEQYLVIKEA